MKNILASLVVLSVLTIALSASASATSMTVAGISGTPDMPSNAACWSPTVANPHIGLITQTCGGSFRAWYLPLPSLIAGTHSVSVTIHTTGAAMDCFAVSSQPDGFIFSSPAVVNAPSTAGDYILQLGNIIQPGPGMGFVVCSVSAVGQGIYSASY